MKFKAKHLAKALDASCWRESTKRLEWIEDQIQHSIKHVDYVISIFKYNGKFYGLRWEHNRKKFRPNALAGYGPNDLVKCPEYEYVESIVTEFKKKN